MKLTDLKGCGTPFITTKTFPAKSRYVVFWQWRVRPRKLGWFRSTKHVRVRCGQYTKNSWHSLSHVSLCPRCFKAAGLEW